MCQIQGVGVSQVEAVAMLADGRFGEVVDRVETVRDCRTVLTAVFSRIVEAMGNERELDGLSHVKNYCVAVMHGDAPAASRFKAMAKECMAHAS